MMESENPWRETFKQWRESPWGQEFKACIKPVQHAEPETQYEQPSLFDKLFGGEGFPQILIARLS